MKYRARINHIEGPAGQMRPIAHSHHQHHQNDHRHRQRDCIRPCRQIYKERTLMLIMVNYISRRVVAGKVGRVVQQRVGTCPEDGVCKYDETSGSTMQLRSESGMNIPSSGAWGHRPSSAPRRHPCPITYFLPPVTVTDTATPSLRLPQSQR